MKLSIVIPAWNEAENLAAALDAAPAEADVIVVDGGSADATAEVARGRGARVVSCERSRALQMNRGAAAARGDVLLFLHADGVLGGGALEAVERALSDPAVVAGSFRLRIRSPARSLALVAFGSNLRARYLQMPYGDQGLFVRRSAFDTVGGFPDVPLLEDVAIAWKLRKQCGRIVQLDVPVTTGARHWEELGALRATLLNWATVGLHLAGVSAETLAPHYQRWRGTDSRRSRHDAPVAQPD